MVRAAHAGRGKTYACKDIDKVSLKVVFVCPTKQLAQNNNNNCIILKSRACWN